MCPLCGDTAGMDLSHIIKWQNLTDNMDSAKNWINGGNYHNYIGLQERKWETSFLTGVG
jgi:hypothetical protein